MDDATITCPHCSGQFPLTETLAKPLLEAAQANFAKTQAERAAVLTRQDQELKVRESELTRAREQFDQEVSTRVAKQTAEMEATAMKKATAAVEVDLEALQGELKAQRDALSHAKKNELELLRQKRDIEQQKEDLALTVQRTLDAERQKIRTEASETASEQWKLQLAEKDRILKDTQRKLEEAKNASEKSSQQLQGDVLEADLATVLGSTFPRDEIVRTIKGQNGADLVHRVIDARGQQCGTILWESKRTKNWSDGWLPKLRNDQRAEHADLAVIVSTTLPDDIPHFGERDGVWIASPAFAPHLAAVLRQQLVQVSQARVAMEGRQEKSALLYDYLTGPQFLQRIRAIAECFTDMQKELLREKTVCLQRWNKREKQIARLLENTVGLYGDVEGISGAALPELTNDLRAIGNEDDDASAAAPAA